MMGLAVTAEGIEDPAQRAALQRIGCSHGQGYLFARPMPAADLASHLHVPVGAAVG
jgi:EAL domain-containing protein (putative c-di-GMP-specific phosphodiesterase class I)